MSTPEDSFNGLPEASQYVATAYLGPPFVGWMLQFVLFGGVVSSFGAYHASKNWKNDSKFIKTLVWAVVGIDCACTFINVWQAMVHGTMQDRTANRLFMVEYVDNLPPLLVGLEAFFVQSFLTTRVAKLFQGHPFVKTAFLCATFSMVMVGWLSSIGACVAGFGFSFGYTDKILPLTYNELVGIWLWVGAGVDVILTVSLILCLRRSVLGFNPSTDGAIRRIMRIALQTASYTSVFGICGAVMSTVFPSSQISTVNSLFAFEFPLASLYALSFLTTLDSRKPIKRSHRTVSVTGSKVPVHSDRTEDGDRSKLTKFVERLSGQRRPSAASAGAGGVQSMEAIRVICSVDVQVEVDNEDQLEMSARPRPRQRPAMPAEVVSHDWSGNHLRVPS